MPIREGIYYEGHMAEAKSVSFTSPLYFFFFDCSVCQNIDFVRVRKEKNIIVIDHYLPSCTYPSSTLLCILRLSFRVEYY